MLCQSVFNWLGRNCVPVSLNACLLPLELSGPHRSSPDSSLNCLHCSLSPSSHSLFYTCLSHSGFECRLPALQMPSSLSEVLYLQLIPPSLQFFTPSGYVRKATLYCLCSMCTVYNFSGVQTVQYKRRVHYLQLHYFFFTILFLVDLFSNLHLLYIY